MHGDQELDFVLDGDYVAFIHLLRRRLANHPAQDNYVSLTDHPLLPEQRCPSRPARWVHINLIVQDEDGVGTKRTTIAVRDDNVYLIGFKNGNGDWYEFGFEQKSMRFIEGSTFLGCDVGYEALVGDPENLVTLDLGKEAMARAVRELSAYQHAGPADVETKGDLARLCFMICEAARMVPHFQTVGWLGGSTFEQQHIDYAQTWPTMSRSLINCPLNDRPRLDEFNVVYLLLNSRLPRTSEGWQWSLPWGGGGVGDGTQQQGKTVQGRPLLEVFDVSIPEDDTVDTIVVFDGKRGQIIYRHDQRNQLRSTTYSALTGPYRAISAEGSVTIQVHGITSDESSNVIGEMFWDCYADDVKYDEVLPGDFISTGTGSCPITKVTYAVLSEAVEATIEVSLLLPGITSVYGEIKAWHPSLAVVDVLLFGREKEEKVELVPSAEDSTVPLELGRSVLAVPLQSRYSCVEIGVRLHVAHPSNKEGDVSIQGLLYLYLDKHTGEIRTKQQLGEITVPGGRAGQTTSVQPVKVQMNITSPGFHVSPLEPESLEHMEITHL